MTKYTYKADSVWFTNDSYYNERILGSLEDKTVAAKSPGEMTYPRFKSYQNVFLIKDIYPGIDYRGGFSMNGSKFIGSGSVEQPATLDVYNNGKRIFRTSAQGYTFQKDNISSRNAHVERKKSKCDYFLSECPSDAQVAEIEARVNEVIAAGIDVSIDFMPKAEAASIVDLSKLPADASDTLRIVRIGDYDACACIGAHVANTSEIGHFSIISHDFNEGVWRLRWKVTDASEKY